MAPKTNHFQKDNFIILVNDTSITYISSVKIIQHADWLSYFEKTQELKNWKIVINQGVRSKAIWFKVVDGKKQPIIQSK